MGLSRQIPVHVTPMRDFANDALLVEDHGTHRHCEPQTACGGDSRQKGHQGTGSRFRPWPEGGSTSAYRKRVPVPESLPPGSSRTRVQPPFPTHRLDGILRATTWKWWQSPCGTDTFLAAEQSNLLLAEDSPRQDNRFRRLLRRTLSSSQ